MSVINTNTSHNASPHTHWTRISSNNRPVIIFSRQNTMKRKQRKMESFEETNLLICELSSVGLRRYALVVKNDALAERFEAITQRNGCLMCNTCLLVSISKCALSLSYFFVRRSVFVFRDYLATNSRYIDTVTQK